MMMCDRNVAKVAELIDVPLDVFNSRTLRQITLESDEGLEKAIVHMDLKLVSR